MSKRSELAIVVHRRWDDNFSSLFLKEILLEKKLRTKTLFLNSSPEHLRIKEQLKCGLPVKQL